MAAVEIARGLAEKNPAREDLAEQLRWSQFLLSDLAKFEQADGQLDVPPAAGDGSDDIVELGRLRDIAQQAADEEPDRTDLRRALAETEVQMGDMEWGDAHLCTLPGYYSPVKPLPGEDERRHRGLAHYEAAFEILEALAKHEPARLDIHEDLVTLSAKLVAMAKADGRTTDAGRYEGRATEISRTMVNLYFGALRSEK